MIKQPFRYNSGIIRFYGTPFFTGDGVTSSATLLDRHGNPITASKLLRVDAMHQTDWQGRQLLYATARTNRILYSQDLTASNWLKLNAGTGIVPVCTANYATAPDGTLTASRVQFDLGATPASATSRIYQQAQSPQAGATQGIWLKSNTGLPQNLYLAISGGLQTVIVVTSSWQQFTHTSNVTVYDQIQFGLGNGSATDTTADILVFGGTSFVGGNSSYIPTTSAPVTVTDYTMTGATASFGQTPLSGAILDWDGVAKR